MRSMSHAAELRHLRRNRQAPADREETLADAEEGAPQATPPPPPPDPTEAPNHVAPNRARGKPTDDAAAEIDSFVACLVSVGRFCLRDRREGAPLFFSARLWTAFLALLCLGLFLLHSHTKGSEGPKRLAEEAQEMVMNFGRFRPNLPPLGAICTHHRSGTVLFLSVGQKWCVEFRMDCERVEAPLHLDIIAATETLEYQHYHKAQEKLVVAMHGFAETCEQTASNGDECGVFDWKCWLLMCNLTAPQGRLPVVHLVRNPVEVLISAYLYHQKDPVPEAWLKEPKPDALSLLPDEVQEEMKSVPYYQVLQRLPPELGLKVEFTVELADMYRMARNYRDLTLYDNGINIKYEEIMADYRHVFERIVDHLTLSEKFEKDRVMQTALALDIKTMDSHTRKDYGLDLHVTEGKTNKAALRQFLYEDEEMRPVFEGLAHVLNYSDPFGLSKRRSKQPKRSRAKSTGRLSVIDDVVNQHINV